MPPWDKYQTAQPSQTGFQGPSGADRIIAPADPYKQANERRAEQDQQFQAQAAARAAADQARQEEQFRITQQREAARDKRQATQDAEGKEYQAKSSSFYGRMLQSQQDWQASKGDNQAPRGTVRQWVHEKYPNAENEYLNDQGRQLTDQAARNFIAAQLRLESGAAIGEQEYQNQYRIFFPMPGDTPDTIAQKARAREQATEAMKLAAGPLADSTAATVQPSKFFGDGLIERDGELFDAQGNSHGLAGTVTDTRPDSPPPPPPSGSDPRDPSGLSGLGALAKQGVTLGLSDEAAGLGGYISGFLTGEDPSKAYARERDTERNFIANARKEWGLAGTGAELLGGGGAARIAAAPTTLAGIMRQGAGIGSIGGFGYGEGDASIPNAAVGAVGGAALGSALYGAGRGLSSLLPARAAPDMAVVEAGQRQNIPIRQPDVRPELRGRYAAAESSQSGGPLVREARSADVNAIENRVAEVGGPGVASDPYALGSRVQSAGGRYIARTRQQANRLYDRARQEAGDATVIARNADAVLDANIQELRAAGENSNSAALNYLQGLRDDIDRGLTLQSVQNLRTNMRGQLSERGLTATDTDRRVNQVIEAMNQDLTEQLPQSASQALRAADDFYRQRQEFITGTLQQFMGNRGNPLPAETAAKRLVSMAQGKGNFERFSRMWGELDQTERADAAATIAASLGRQQNGNFSAAALIKSLDPRNGINPRTASLVFGDEGARALNDLRAIAQAKGEAMNRQSPSGQAIGAQIGNLKTLLMGALGFSAGGPGGAAAGAVGREFLSRWGEQRAARMLLNPDFTRWLRNAPNTANPRAIDAYFSRLAGIGAANDNQAFVSALRGSLSQSPGSVAASTEQKDEARRVPPQQ